MVTAALADAEVSARLTALTATLPGELGAVYSPLAPMVPVAAVPPVTPFTFQATDWFAEFFTVAVNCSVLPIRTEAEVGEMVTLTGGGDVTITDAVPTADGIAWLVA